MSQRSPSRDPRRVHVPAPDAGSSGAAVGGPVPPRARAGGDAGRSAVQPAPRPKNRSGGSRPGDSRPKPAGRQSQTAPKPKTGKRRRFLPHRPKLRRVLLLASIGLPLLLLLAAVGGYLYAKSIFDRIEKVEVSDVLAGAANGDNYLIVGSDTRDAAAIEEAGLNPGAFEDGGGTRSDTMLVLHFGDDGAKMLSIPRDLYLPIAETGSTQKINAAYNGGPRRLILTVQQSLGIPIDRYLEVDFISFAGVVDAVGGITIDFPHPATDAGSGLNVTEAGPTELDGEQALAYVRSRRYTEIIDGRTVTDPTADLGRVQRQQTFLRAVFKELGSTFNPLSLARAADGAADGLRIDDGMSLVDGIRFAWRLRSLDPEPLELPTTEDRNGAGAVLLLQNEAAQPVLDQLR